MSKGSRLAADFVPSKPALRLFRELPNSEPYTPSTQPVNGIDVLAQQMHDAGAYTGGPAGRYLDRPLCSIEGVAMTTQGPISSKCCEDLR